MVRRIITNSNRHPLLSRQIAISNDNHGKACSQGKLVIRPSQLKVDDESPSFLQRIQGDICGPIQPLCGPFRYFMVLVDASTRWSHVCLLSTRNVAFVRLIAQIIKLRAQFPDHPIKSIRLDNAGEFTSQTFDDYCMTLGIDVEHLVPHVHTKKWFGRSIDKVASVNSSHSAYENKIASFCMGTCHLTCCIIGSIETYSQPLILHSITCVWASAKHFTFTSFWLCCLCAYCTPATH